MARTIIWSVSADHFAIRTYSSKTSTETLRLFLRRPSHSWQRVESPYSSPQIGELEVTTIVLATSKDRQIYSSCLPIFTSEGCIYKVRPKEVADYTWLAFPNGDGMKRNEDEIASSLLHRSGGTNCECCLLLLYVSVLMIEVHTILNPNRENVVAYTIVDQYIRWGSRGNIIVNEKGNVQQHVGSGKRF